MESCEQAEMIADRGIKGDRYAELQVRRLRRAAARVTPSPLPARPVPDAFGPAHRAPTRCCVPPPKGPASARSDLGACAADAYAGTR